MSWRSWVVPAGVSDWAAQRSKYLTQFDDSGGTWEAAQAQSSGYDSREILSRVTTSTQAVLRAEAAFERDGVAFTAPQYRWPVLAGLLEVAARDGELKVLDFGGSLGSLYWQHRKFFSGFKVSWGVVEQPEFVAVGKGLDQSTIEFFCSVTEYLESVTPNVVLLSSVLQYLPNPEQTLRELLATPADTVILDRTPISTATSNVPCLQVVPQHIYAGSYPAWIFSNTWLRNQFAGWEIVAEFDGIEPAGHTQNGIHFSWDGLIAQRKAND
ncbi:methyltransferase, TIGR04325 family [Arsukibacterium sp.]|uniref:methyltransferase, TIGR04325 family n=1 Tax=Arsukibacterium sp. TaxID=1977258 RepID=UPI001BD25445